MIFDLNEIQDIQNLIDNSITETLTLDYKRELGNGEKSNKEIAKDVSAFANTKGGVIVYGVEEEKGKPISINWINNEGVKERIENVILSNTQPKLEGCKIQQIDNPNNKEESVFVVTIPESTDSPHMVNHRYYIRRNFKSEPMEDHEVKNAIFKKGLREALFEEIEYNEQLAGKIMKKIDELYYYNPQDREFTVFVPFRTEAWRFAISSGLFSLIKEGNKGLIDLYNLIYEINYLIELQKIDKEDIVTQIDDAKPDKGKYLISIIREKVSEMLGLLVQVKSVQ